jgi:hypothetical protein
MIGVIFEFGDGCVIALLELGLFAGLGAVKPIESRPILQKPLRHECGIALSAC